MEEVIDLDIIRPKGKKVRLAGKIIDVSFIPCGITFEVDDVVRQISSLDQEKITTDLVEAKKAFSLAVRLCAIFASVEYPEINEDWMMKHCSAEQINVLSDAIKEALIESYKGIERYGKN